MRIENTIILDAGRHADIRLSSTLALRSSHPVGCSVLQWVTSASMSLFANGVGGGGLQSQDSDMS